MRHGLAIACRRSDFRICHVSVQGDHIHLIVEADTHVALARDNWRRHREDIHDRRAFDPDASARAFDGWANNPRRFHLEAIPVVMATTWHLTHGWRRYGPIETHARPGPIEPAR